MLSIHPEDCELRGDGLKEEILAAVKKFGEHIHENIDLNEIGIFLGDDMQTLTIVYHPAENDEKSASTKLSRQLQVWTMEYLKKHLFSPKDYEPTGRLHRNSLVFSYFENVFAGEYPCHNWEIFPFQMGGILLEDLLNELNTGNFRLEKCITELFLDSTTDYFDAAATRARLKTWGKWQVILKKVRVSTLCAEDMHMESFYKMARKKNLKPFHFCETVFQMRKQYKDQPKGERLYVAMEDIEMSDLNGRFYLENKEHVLWIGFDESWRHNYIEGEEIFIFETGCDRD